jgi:hypothetical protein
MKGGKRSQGLPLSFIVIAVLAVLVLVLILGFATGTIPKLFGGAKMLAEEATPEQTASFRLGCEQACNYAKQLADTEEEWKASDYCKRLRDKKHCWHADVAVFCSKGTFSYANC